ncbi:2-dehydro-3-deoxygluconokinase, partial [Bacillus sp. MB366]
SIIVVDVYMTACIDGERNELSTEKAVSFWYEAGMIAHTIVGDTPMSSEKDILRAMTASVGNVER